MSLIKPSFSTGYAKNASESANPNLWKGLVGAWMPSFGVTGNTLKDVSGNGNDGTLTNMDSSNFETASGGSLSFNGSNEYGSFGQIDPLNIGSSDFSVRMSILPLTWKGTWNPVLVVAQTGGFWMGRNGSGNFVLRAYGVTDLISYSLPPNYSTTDVVVTRRSGVGRLYYDGRLVASASVTYNFASGNAWLADDGNHKPAELFRGNLSKLSIYNRALSPTEIKQLYINPSAPFERKQQTVGISTAQAFNPYWANQATQLAGTLQ